MKVTPIGKKFFKHSPGDVFELPDKLAAALIRAGKLRNVAADDSPPAPVKVVAKRAPAKRTYQRRDMQAAG
jgi:hypothetical protein